MRDKRIFDGMLYIKNEFRSSRCHNLDIAAMC